MKFDKETIIAIVICGILLIGWEPFCRKMGWISPVNPQQQTVAEPAASEKAQATPHAPQAKAPEVKAETAPAMPKLPWQTLENGDMAVTFDPNRGCIDNIVMKKFLDAGRKAPIRLDNNYSLQPGALSLTMTAGGQTAYAVKVLENTRPDERTYRLSRLMRNSAGEEAILTQQWHLDDAYGIDCVFSLRTAGTPFRAEAQLSVGDIQSWSKLSGDYLRSDPHEFAYMTGNGEYDTIDATAKKEEKLLAIGDRELKWAALTNKYFALIVVPEKPAMFKAARILLDSDKRQFAAAITSGGISIDLAAGGSFEYNFRYYAGPKESDSLNAFEPGSAKIIHYSWGPINTLAKWLLWCLERLRALCGSYGVSIILLTLIVRLIFYPVTMKANNSMQKMQAVQPRIKELREKYKDNPQLLNTKMMELYRTEKINPFGGCLPILLQIPVFFALYAALDGALQLRQVPFLWSPDLAGPDTVFSYPLPFHIFGIANFHLNPLVIAMTGFMVLQQHLTPNTMEPVQRKMMMLMPFMMLIFLYELPSGLTLYWTVSNIFSIVQLLIQQKLNRKAAMAAGR